MKNPPLKAIEKREKDKFEDQWYVIANTLHFAEKNKVATKTNYKKQGLNLHDDIFNYRDHYVDGKEKTKVGSIKK